jgi:hypothetical protein
MLVSEIHGSAWRGSWRMKSAAEQGGGSGTLCVSGDSPSTGRNRLADIAIVAG